MTFKITVASNEVEDFVLEILIDADSTFHDLHKTILKACKYQEGSNHTIYICDENWRSEQRILLNDDGSTSSDEDLFLMEDTILGDFLEDEGQRIAYRFDPESRRLFLLELSEISFGARQEKPEVKRRHGVPPLQSEPEDETDATPTPTPTDDEDAEMGESFYGDEGFEAEEFDEEGFETID